MSAYLPTTALAVVAPVSLLAAEGVALALLLRGARSRGGVLAAWIVLLAGFSMTVLLTSGQPAGFRMVALISVVFIGMKAVVLANRHMAGKPLPGRWRLALFVVAWPGMNPDLILHRGKANVTGTVRLGARGLAYVLLGGALLLGARAAYQAWVGTYWTALPLVAAMVAFSLVVHFGLFGLCAGMWRLAGFPAHELFREPWRARSLAEFWGRRWNLAYVEMITLAVYRPARCRWGENYALALAFLVSGLLHEAAISFPVGWGYGLPTLYFLMQGAAVRIERLPMMKQVLCRKTARRAWMWTWLTVPAPILFYPAFVQAVVAPLLAPA